MPHLDRAYCREAGPHCTQLHASGGTKRAGWKGGPATAEFGNIQASEVNSEALLCFHLRRKRRTGESGGSQTGKGGGEENVQGAAIQLFFPETRSSLLDNCRNRSALASTLVKHQWKVLPGWSAANRQGRLISVDQNVKTQVWHTHSRIPVSSQSGDNLWILRPFGAPMPNAATFRHSRS